MLVGPALNSRGVLQLGGSGGRAWMNEADYALGRGPGGGLGGGVRLITHWTWDSGRGWERRNEADYALDMGLREGRETKCFIYRRK